MDRTLCVLRWIARLWGTAMFLLWGAFFVEHVREWFLASAALPPPHVIGIVAVHGVMLCGLALAWRWETAGGVTALAAAGVFFALSAGSGFPAFFALTGFPALLWILCGFLSRRPRPGQTPAATGP